jgi:hypothetical protein
MEPNAMILMNAKATSMIVIRMLTASTLLDLINASVHLVMLEMVTKIVNLQQLASVKKYVTQMQFVSEKTLIVLQHVFVIEDFVVMDIHALTSMKVQKELTTVLPMRSA